MLKYWALMITKEEGESIEKYQTDICVHIHCFSYLYGMVFYDVLNVR